MTAKSYLKQSVKLHREASALANRARIAHFNGDEDAYLQFTRQAFRKESESAKLLREDPSHHMFAILHRSAATLAYRCREYGAAEDFILYGLRLTQNERLRTELYALFDRVRLAVRYGAGESEVDGEDLVMTMQGVEANNGLIEPSTLSRRITRFASLVRNTIARENRHSFRNRSKVDQEYRVLAKALAPGSYKIGMTMTYIGSKRFPSFTYFDGVRSKVLNNLRLVNGGDMEGLKDSIKDDKYLQNIVGLAKELAPDRQVINAVGVEARIEGQYKSVLLDCTRDDLNELVLPMEEELVANEYQIIDDRETVIGELQFADATQDVIKLLTDDGKWWHIVVPEGLADEVVKPYFGDRVRVDGRHMVKTRKARRLYLDDIRAADEHTIPHLQVITQVAEA